jgi:hypothetical protein
MISVQVVSGRGCLGCLGCPICDDADSPNENDNDLLAAQKAFRRTKRNLAAGKPTLSVKFGDLLKKRGFK